MIELAILSLFAALLTDAAAKEQQRERDAATKLRRARAAESSTVKRFRHALKILIDVAVSNRERVERRRLENRDMYRPGVDPAVPLFRGFYSVMSGVVFEDLDVRTWAIGDRPYRFNDALSKVWGLSPETAEWPVPAPDFSPSWPAGSPAEALIPWVATQLARAYRTWARSPTAGKELYYHASIELVRLLDEQFSSLVDWVEAERPDLGRYDAAAAVAASQAWHAQFREASFGSPLPPALPILSFPDGARIDRLVTPRQLEDEGESMAHCVGGYWSRVRDDKSLVFSYRDPRGIPMATWEVTRRKAGGVELQQLHGPEDGEVLNPTARLRVAAWLRTVAPQSATFDDEDLPRYFVEDDVLAALRAMSERDSLTVRWMANADRDALKLAAEEAGPAVVAAMARVASRDADQAKRLEKMDDAGLLALGDQYDALEMRDLSDELVGDLIEDLPEEILKRVADHGIDWSDLDTVDELVALLRSDADFRAGDVLLEDANSAMAEAALALGGHLGDKRHGGKVAHLGSLSVVLEGGDRTTFAVRISHDHGYGKVLGQGASPALALISSGLVTSPREMREAALVELGAIATPWGDVNGAEKVAHASMRTAIEAAKARGLADADSERALGLLPGPRAEYGAARRSAESAISRS